MSGASNVLDPVEAAQDDINRSKRVIASALDDLTHHHSWLEGYHRDERRRAERLRRQEALEALKLRRQRAAWLARRYTLTAYAAARATASFLAKNSAAFLAWAAPRAEALARIIARDIAAALSWSWRTGRVLARRGFDETARGFVWSVHASNALGVAFRARLSAESARLYAEAAIRARPFVQPIRKRASVSWTRAQVRSARFAAAQHTRLSHVWSHTRSKAPLLAQDAATAISQSYAQLSANAVHIAVRERDRFSAWFAQMRTHSQDAMHAGVKAARQTWSWTALQTRHVVDRGTGRTKHRALIVRQCTALVRFEPLRTRLPVVRTD